MIKKSLEEKIKDIIFGTIVFFIFYGVIGFLLESDWLSKKIDLPKVYEILKDGLTITASFLAPVAAFVLFTDWRQEHVAKLLDSLARKIRVDINDLSIHFTRAHFKPAVEIRKENYVVELIKHPVKGSILDMRLSLMNDLLELKNSIREKNELLEKFQEFINLTINLENLIVIYKFEENEIKEARIRAFSQECLVVKKHEATLIRLSETYVEVTKEMEKYILELDQLLGELILK